jgi:hypothetical protein
MEYMSGRLIWSILGIGGIEGVIGVVLCAAGAKNFIRRSTDYKRLYHEGLYPAFLNYSASSNASIHLKHEKVILLLVSSYTQP